MVLLSGIASDARDKSLRLLILGLDNAGKSTITARWFSEPITSVAPTDGFNIKTRRWGPLEVHCWDIGGQSSLRPFWCNYYHASDALVWVIDSGDIDRFGVCLEELTSVIDEPGLAGIVIWILANKQDVGGALTTARISEVISSYGIQSLNRHKINIVGCSAYADSDEKMTMIFGSIVRTVAANVFSTAVLPSEEIIGDADETPRCREEVDWDAVPVSYPAWGWTNSWRARIGNAD